jgi:nitrogen fixation NifU-like protein
MEDQARERVLDHYENPRHHGRLADVDGSCEDINPLCGDRVRIDVKLDAEHMQLLNAAFEGDGCVISQATASMLLDDAVGRLVDAIEQLEPQHVLGLIGMPLSPQRIKCALLSFTVLKGALRAARVRAHAQGGTETETDTRANAQKTLTE